MSDAEPTTASAPLTRSEIEMSLLELAQCRCGHDDDEHLGACRTDVFTGGTWSKCDCQSFDASGVA